MVNGDYSKLNELYSEVYSSCKKIIDILKRDAPYLFGEATALDGIELWTDGVEICYSGQKERGYIFVNGYVFEEKTIDIFCRNLIEKRKKEIWN